MVNALAEKGREGFLDGSIDYDTDTIKAALLDLTVADTAIKAITGATAATPIVITATAHGFSNGDLVYINQVGGNTAANGYWKIANVATNTFELTDPVTATNATGVSAYTSGGYALNYGPSASGDFYDDINAAALGTDQALGSRSVTAGVAGAANPTWPTVTTGSNVHAVALYKDTGTASTSRIIGYYTGRHIVTCAANASAAATSIAVDPLTNPIPTGTVLAFSNGRTATMSALANAGDRSISVSALANGITAGNRALAPVTGNNMPLPTNGSNITMTIDTGAFKLFKL
jgi:hypothetical protein